MGKTDEAGKRGWRSTGSAVVLLAAAAVAGPASIATGSALDRTVRIGELPRLAAGARVIGALAASTPIHVTIALKPRDSAALAAFAAAVSTPGSSVYRDYLTPAQFAQRFGASPASWRLSRARCARTAWPAVGQRQPPLGPRHRQRGAGRAGVLAHVPTDGIASGRQAVVASAAPALDRKIAGDVQAVVGLSSLAAPQPLSVRPALLRPRLAMGACRHSRSHTSPPVGHSRARRLARRRSRRAPTRPTRSRSAYGFSGLYGAGDPGPGPDDRAVRARVERPGGHRCLSGVLRDQRADLLRPGRRRGGQRPRRRRGHARHRAGDRARAEGELARLPGSQREHGLARIGPL